jgi:hypothetical protein
MTRKMTTMVCVLSCLFSIPLTAGPGTALTIGGNYWHAQRALSGEYWTDVRSEAGNLAGPYAQFRVGRWLLGMSMYFGTFEEYGVHDELYIRKYSFNNKRSDLNFSVGYSFLEGVTVFAASKNLAFNAGENNLSSYDIGGSTYYGTRKCVDKGTMFGGGASGLVRISKSRFFLCASAAYLAGKRKQTDKITSNDGRTAEYNPESKTDNSIVALSGSIGYQAGGAMTVLVGYRADMLDFKNRTDGMKGREKVHGINCTLAYTL